jgi:hypothetical protein
MFDEPSGGDNKRKAARQLYYEAEELIRGDYETDEDSLASTKGVQPFLESALESCGWTEGNPPVVEFDIPDQHEFSGFVRDQV